MLGLSKIVVSVEGYEKLHRNDMDDLFEGTDRFVARKVRQMIVELGVLEERYGVKFSIEVID